MREHFRGQCDDLKASLTLTLSQGERGQTLTLTLSQGERG